MLIVATRVAVIPNVFICIIIMHHSGYDHTLTSNSSLANENAPLKHKPLWIQINYTNLVLNYYFNYWMLITEKYTVPKLLNYLPGSVVPIYLTKIIFTLHSCNFVLIDLIINHNTIMALHKPCHIIVWACVWTISGMLFYGNYEEFFSFK